MTGIDSKTFINGIGNDLKTSIDDIICVILTLHEDVDKLKIKTSKPSKAAARAILEYLAMEECKAKENLEALCGGEIKQYLKWVDNYCEENACTQEQALNEIIEGAIWFLGFRPNNFSKLLMYL